MDPVDAILIPNLPWVIAGGMLLGGLAIAGWIFTTWLKVRNGYPLEGMWGQAIHPKITSETSERIKLLSGENAQLRAELGSVKDRLQVVERIVTDGAGKLDREIDKLRDDRMN